MPYPASFRGMRNLRLIDVATLNFIRRWVLREQMSIREISRRTGLARNTVKKYLRSDETEPTYVERISPTKLAYAEKLATWLGIEATRSRKQRCYLKRIKTGLLFLMLSERNVDATGRSELQGDRRQPLQTRCSNVVQGHVCAHNLSPMLLGRNLAYRLRVSNSR